MDGQGPTQAQPFKLETEQRSFAKRTLTAQSMVRCHKALLHSTDTLALSQSRKRPSNAALTSTRAPRQDEGETGKSAAFKARPVPEYPEVEVRQTALSLSRIAGETALVRAEPSLHRKEVEVPVRALTG